MGLLSSPLGGILAMRASVVDCVDGTTHFDRCRLDEEPTWLGRAGAYLVAALALIIAIAFILYSYAGAGIEPGLFEDANRFPRLAAHEVGFAFLVAVIIWSVFELSTRLDDETRWHSRVQVISKNVFMAVFRSTSSGRSSK